MDKKGTFLKSTALPIITLILSVLALVLHRSFKTNWVYMGSAMMILFVTMTGFFILAAVLAWLRLNNKSFCEKKGYSVLVAVCSVMVLLYFLFTVVYSGIMINSDNKEIYFMNFCKTLSKTALIIVVPFLLLFFPKLGKAKKVVGALLLLVIAVYCINGYFPLTPHKITSDPVVIDNGSAYSVVFSTNDEGAGYIEYTYDGVDYKVYDQTGGRINSGRIHSIIVPYEHLKNNSYTISSYRVIEQFSYGSRIGQPVTSEEYTLVVNESDDQSWLVVSDWHTHLEKVYTAVGHLGDYDGVILLGDSSSGLDYEEQVINNIVQFGGELSHGTKPVLFIRGNHETRGAYADELQDALGLDSWYYTADVGPYSFVILDSTEDKVDSHIEYGSLADFATQRAEVIEWLQGVTVENEKVIAISHAWEISEIEEDLSNAGFAELDRLGARLLLSAHYHKCRFLGESSDREKEIFGQYPDLIGYLDGGKVGSGADYIASKVVFTAEGFEIIAANTAGDIIVNESFDWQE